MKGLLILALICLSSVYADFTICPDGLYPTTGDPACDFYKVLDSYFNPEDTYESRGMEKKCCLTCKHSPWAISFPAFGLFLRIEKNYPHALYVADNFASATLYARVSNYYDSVLNNGSEPYIAFWANFYYTEWEGKCNGKVTKELADKCYEQVTAGGYVNPHCWQCFSNVTGTLTGVVGSLFENIVFEILQVGHSPQFGEGANGKNSGLGHSFSFLWRVADDQMDAAGRITNTRYQIPKKKEDCKAEVAVNLYRHRCPPPPSFKGDPHFVGFLGQKYDFHGQANQVFSIISDETVQLNGLFVNADLRPKKIDKTYIGALGLMVGQHKLHIACDRINNERIIEFDGDELEADEIVSLENEGTIMRDSEDRIIIDLPQYYIKTRFSSSAHSSCHINMRASYIAGDYDLPHGVLGQSANPAKAVITKSTGMQGEGIVDGHWTDYRIAGDDLFGTNFIYNKFNVLKQTEASVEKRSISTIH